MLFVLESWEFRLIAHSNGCADDAGSIIKYVEGELCDLNFKCGGGRNTFNLKLTTIVCENQAVVDVEIF